MNLMVSKNEESKLLSYRYVHTHAARGCAARGCEFLCVAALQVAQPSK